MAALCLYPDCSELLDEEVECISAKVREPICETCLAEECFADDYEGVRACRHKSENGRQP